MATDDEPLDDLRDAGMTAGVAPARVVETIARDAQQRVQQQREAVAAQWQAATEAALAVLQRARQTGPRQHRTRQPKKPRAQRCLNPPNPSGTTVHRGDSQ